MTNDKLLIPDTIKVGYQKREDTYTGKLAYVIYYDKKGVLRKETSWNSWRDKSKGADEFKNIPTDGFVLNKEGGGNRNSYGWNPRNEFIRVHDPRGFEFEISLPNLLFILKETDCTKGKGLNGKFVYSWDGVDLVLLPEASAEYKNCVSYTDLQDKKVGAKELVPGYTYQTKKQELLMYLGKYQVFNIYTECTKPKYVFYSEVHSKIVIRSGLTSLANCSVAEVHKDYAKHNAAFLNGPHGSPIKELVLVPSKDTLIDRLKDNYKYPYQISLWSRENNGYQLVNFHYHHIIDKLDLSKDSIDIHPNNITTELYNVVDGKLKCAHQDRNYLNWNATKNRIDINGVVTDLVVKLESGKKIPFKKYVDAQYDFL